MTTSAQHRAPRAYAVAGAGLLLMTGCSATPRNAEPVAGPPETGIASTGPAVPLDERNTLYPGNDGVLPVSVRWVHQLAVPEGFAVLEDVIYVSDECLVTLSLSSGEELWRACKASGDGIFSDGGDEIGPAGPGRIRVYAWYNDNLLIDTATHRVIERGIAGGDRPAGFTPFPARLDRTYEIGGWRGKGVAARDAQGRVAWRVRTEDGWMSPTALVRSPSGGIFITESGLMVSLDYKQ